MDPAMRCYYSCIQQFRMVKGVLYYEWLDDFGSRSLRVFAPRSLRRKIIEGCHDQPSSGHQGEKKTRERVKRSFYWYGLTADVLHYVATCAMCGASKDFHLGKVEQHYSRMKRCFLGPSAPGFSWTFTCKCE